MSKHTVQERTDICPLKSGESHGRKAERVSSSLDSSPKIPKTCMIRWYRAGENWNPRDCNLTATLVVG